MKRLSKRAMAELMATSEVCGMQLSEVAADLMEQDLVAYPELALIAALGRCRREVKHRLTLADIIERIDDGRPSADEAWAQVGTLDENRTIVTTTEALHAMTPEIRELLGRDETAARMAYRESYRRVVTDSKTDGVPAQWTASLGHDKGQRETVLRDAIERGRLSEQQAKVYGILDEPKGEPLKLLPGKTGGRNELAAANFATVLRVLDGGLSADEAERQIERRYGVKR